MNLRGILPATLPGKLVLAATLITLAAGGFSAAGFLTNQSGTASGQYSGVSSPTAGAGFPVIALGIGAYWLVRRHRRKS